MYTVLRYFFFFKQKTAYEMKMERLRCEGGRRQRNGVFGSETVSRRTRRRGARTAWLRRNGRTRIRGAEAGSSRRSHDKYRPSPCEGRGKKSARRRKRDRRFARHEPRFRNQDGGRGARVHQFHVFPCVLRAEARGNPPGGSFVRPINSRSRREGHGGIRQRQPYRRI